MVLGDMTSLIASYLNFLQGLLDVVIVQQIFGFFFIVGTVHLLKKLVTMWN